jgi:glycosyltransferase involved in cell wall biosynthesis
MTKGKVYIEGSVCFLNYDLSFGGTEKVIVSLANYLSAQKRKVTILLLSNKNDFKDFLSPEVEIISLDISKIKYFIFYFAIFIRKQKFNNFISNVWPLTSLSFLVRALSPKTKLIYVEHCNLTEQFRERSYFFKICQNLSIKYLYKFAHSVVTVSAGLKDDLIKKGVLSSKITTIYNPVICVPPDEQTEIKIGNSDLIDKWLTHSGKKIIAVGEFKPQKNFINLVNAFSLLRKKIDIDASLLILGDGQEMNEIRNAIKSQDLDKHIFLPGWVKDPLPYFKFGDIFALSSNYEGFGVVIVEALSQGLNVVSTDCKSGPSEILKDGEFGFLCPIQDSLAFAESMEKALKNPLPEAKLLQRSFDFTEEKIGKLYEEILLNS